MSDDFFVETTITRGVRASVEYALQSKTAVVIKGKAGQGKTATLLREIDRRRPIARGIYWRANVGDRTARAALCSLADILGDHYGSHFSNASSAKAAFEAIEEFLTGWQGWHDFLVVDEAHKIDVSVLQEISDFPYRHGFPVVFCGNDKLLKRSRATAGALDQIESRCGRQFIVGEASEEDHKAIAAAYGVVGKDALQACVQFAAKQSIRELVEMLSAARAGSTGGDIGSNEIREATAFLKKKRGLRMLSRDDDER
jgi:DNA transposition AAA+ family ATPase